MAMQLDTIGVLIDILDEEYQNQLFTGAAAAARAHGARVVGFVGGALDEYLSGTVTLGFELR